MPESPVKEPKLRKGKFAITGDHYQTAKTQPLCFTFEADSFPEIAERFRSSSIQYHNVDDQDVYIIDGFFREEDAEELRQATEQGGFSREIYAAHESREGGEEPSRAMSNQEKWTFFSKPPRAIKDLYRLLCSLADELDAEISTLPWELCDKDICAPAFATNWVESMPPASAQLGKHDDYSTQRGIPFAVPQLYSEEGSLHDSQFENGAPGKPWFITIMVYATHPKFQEDYGMGTQFYSKDNSLAAGAKIQHMRMVLFEGDIIHAIEESHIPEGVSTWRVSYVFKLLCNPRKADQSVKEQFRERFQKS